MNTASKRSIRVGTAVTAVVSLFVFGDSITHLLNIEVVRTAMTELGYPDHLAPIIGVIELACLAIFLWPRTALIGAVLLTSYLGGAVATNLRVEKPLFGTVLFPVYVAAVLWLGTYLRNAPLRDLLSSMIKPTRRSTATITSSLSTEAA
jgi:DoxX-like family